MELLAVLERLISMGYLRAGTLAVFVFVVTFAVPTHVTACSIALPPDPEQILRHQVESASLVFIGQVVAEKDFIFLRPGERRPGRATVQPVAARARRLITQLRSAAAQNLPDRHAIL